MLQGTAGAGGGTDAPAGAETGAESAAGESNIYLEATEFFLESQREKSCEI